MTTVFYTKDHEWVEILDTHKVRIGITDFAQEELGDIVYVDLPELGDEFDEDDDFGTVESVKSVSEVLTPFAGVVVTINEALDGEPELVNDDAMGEGWFIELKTEEDVDTTILLSKEEYASFLEE